MSIPPPPGPQQPQPHQGPYQAPPPGPYGPYGDPYGPTAHYQTWGQGYSPFNRPVPVNGLAIASLVLGILCFLPAVGLVLGVIALFQIKKRGERGRGMAIGGAVMSTIGLVLWTLSLTLGWAADFWEGVKEGARERTNFSVSTGECFDTPSGSLEGYTYDVDEVPCAGEHDGEVFAVHKISGSAYPGDSRVGDIADDKCYTLQDKYAMDTWAMPENVDVYYYVPTEDSWSLGDREITCVFGNTDEDGTLTGSLRSDSTTLDADQLVFLQALNALDATLYQEPEEYPEEELEINQDWAGDVEAELGTQITALRAHTWQSGSQKAVDALVKDMEAARKEWAKAAKADDADTFYVHYDSGYEYVDGDTTVTAREVLGLASTPPSYDDYDDSVEEDSSSGGLDV